MECGHTNVSASLCFRPQTYLGPLHTNAGAEMKRYKGLKFCPMILRPFSLMRFGNCSFLACYYYYTVMCRLIEGARSPVSTQSSFYLTEYQVHAPRGALTGAQDPNGAPTDIQGSKPVLVFYFD